MLAVLFQLAFTIGICLIGAAVLALAVLCLWALRMLLDGLRGL